MFVKKSVSMTKFIYWSSPPIGWVKLNVNGSRDGDLGMIVAGGVIKSEDSLWLGGFSINKGEGSVVEAELWGVYEGIMLA
ncbi:hypothetical protein ACOSQ4_004852 [Xanthoceras sorbifolium]